MLMNIWRWKRKGRDVQTEARAAAEATLEKERLGLAAMVAMTHYVATARGVLVDGEAMSDEATNT